MLQPTSSSSYNRDISFKTFHIIKKRRLRPGKFDSYVRMMKEIIGIKIFLIIYIYNRHNIVSSFVNYLFYLMPHFPITNQCNIHKIYKSIVYAKDNNL